MNSTNLIKAIGDINKKIKNNLSKNKDSNNNTQQSISISKHFNKDKEREKIKINENVNNVYSTQENINEDDLFTFHNLKLNQGLEDSVLRKIFQSKILKDMNLKKEKIEFKKDGSFKDEFFEN